MISKIAICTFASLIVTCTLAETPAEIDAQLNKIGAEQIELGGKTKNMASELEHELRSGKHDTPEMKELRNKIKQLEAQIREAELELHRKFAELPEFKEKASMVSTNFARLRELGAERARLLEQRKAQTK